MVKSFKKTTNQTKTPKLLLGAKKFTFIMKHSFCLCNENISIHVYKSKIESHSEAFKANILCLKFTETGVSQPTRGLK